MANVHPPLAPRTAQVPRATQQAPQAASKEAVGFLKGIGRPEIMLAAFWAWAVPFVAIAPLYLERPWTSIEGVDDQIKDFFNFCVQLAFLLHICSIVTWIPTMVLCHRNSKTKGTSSISNYFYSLWSNVLGLTIVIDAVLLFSASMVLCPELLATILFLALVSIVCWMCT